MGNIVDNWFIDTALHSGLALNPGTNNGVTSTPLIANGRAYFADWQGHVYEANISTGNIIWDVYLGNAISSTQALSNGVLYVSMGPNGPTKVYALNANTGAPIWNTTLVTNTVQLYGSPTIYRGMLYIGLAGDFHDAETNLNSTGALFALNTTTGNEVWHFDTRANSSVPGGDGVWDL